MEKRFFIKASHIENENHYFINYFGQDACAIARDYKSGERHSRTTMRSDYIKRHGYKTQRGAENSANFKRFINDGYYTVEIICYYC